MNIKKLLAHNLRVPLAARINSDELRRRESIARSRGESAAILASIHEELKEQIAAIYKPDEWTLDLVAKS